MVSVKRFDVWLVDLNPAKGREINKTRPCIVISPNEMSALSTVLMAPMTVTDAFILSRLFDPDPLCVNLFRKLIKKIMYISLFQVT